MFRHEMASLRELVTVRHRGAAVRVTITLADVGPRAPFSVDIDADPEIAVVPALLDGWKGLVHDGQEAWFRVAYYDAKMRSFPSFFLDGPLEWACEWLEVTPHPVIEAARARTDAAERERAKAEYLTWKAESDVR